jgi:hypothetical protein
VSPTLPPPPGPATREIPLVDPAGAAGSATPQPATGPVGYGAGPSAPGPAVPPPDTAVLPPPSVPATAEAPAAPVSPGFVVDLTDEPRGTRAHRVGGRASTLLLGALSAVVLEIGLLVPGGTPALWARVPLWSAFATIAGVAALAGVAARLAGRHRARALRAAVAGLGGLAVFWLLVVLPTAATDRGFLLTAGFAGMAAAVRTAGRGGEPAAVEAAPQG